MLNCMATYRNTDKKPYDNNVKESSFEVRKHGLVNSLLGGADMEKFDVNNTIGSPAVSAGISGITISGSVLPRVLEITKPDVVSF